MVEAASLLAFSLTSGPGNVASLVPLRDSSLALVATLLTVTLETPGTGAAANGVAADMVASFLPGNSVLVTQGLSRAIGGKTGGDEVETAGQADDGAPTPVAQVATT